MFSLVSKFCLIYLFINLINANDQLINFVPDTDDFDLIASETNQFNSIIDLTTDEYLRECLEAHNAKRKLHGSEDLILDKKLLNDAKEAAFQSALNGKLTKLEDSPYGENLASSTKRLTCTNAVNLWYKQNTFYNYHVPLYTKQTGGFTQLVWRDTKRFACAQARLKNGPRYYTVCVYDPFGNVSGQFRGNIFPPTFEKKKHTTSNNRSINDTLLKNNSKDTVAKKTYQNIDTNVLDSTLYSSPLDVQTNPRLPNYLVKPIINKNYRVSPGMLMKFNNLNKQKKIHHKTVVSYETNLDASASEINLFVKTNTISPTLDTIEISNLIERKINETDLISDTEITTLNTNYDQTTVSSIEIE